MLHQGEDLARWEKNKFFCCLIGSLKMILGGLVPKKSFSFLYKGVK